MKHRYHELATKVLKAHPELESIGTPPTEMVDAMASAIESRFGTPILPVAGETTAVTLDTPRTAALFFDRIWQPPGMESACPRELTVFGATDFEVWPLVVMLAMKPPRGLDWEKVQTIFGENTPIAELWAHREIPGANKYSAVLAREYGIKAIPVYQSMERFEEDHHPGSAEVIVAALSGLEIIEEEALSWEQVIEVRNDSAAKTKLRRLRHWYDSAMVGKPLSYVRDELTIRLDDYEWALKKHGIKTVTGVASELLDPKFLASVAASSAGLALAGLDFWAAVGAAGAILGRVALSVTTKLVDLAEATRSGSEVAFIHDLKKLATGSRPKKS